MATWGPPARTVKGSATIWLGNHGQSEKAGRPGPGRGPQARGQGPHRQGPEDRLDPLAATPAQRSLCRGGEAAGLSFACRVQADRDRRPLSCAQAGDEGGRPRRGARRLEPGRSDARRRSRRQRPGGRRRSRRHRADPGRRGAHPRRERKRSARPHQGRARRPRRRCALGHGPGDHRPSRHRSPPRGGAGGSPRSTSPKICSPPEGRSWPRCSRAAPAAISWRG